MAHYIRKGEPVPNILLVPGDMEIFDKNVCYFGLVLAKIWYT